MASHQRPNRIKMIGEHTKGDAGILGSQLLTIFIGEEHVGAEATLGRNGFCDRSIGTREPVSHG